MAKVILSAKSGSDWTENELHAFNIRVASVGTAQFFGNTILPPAAISPAILNNAQMPPDSEPISKDDRLFFEYLTDAERASSEESAVDDFAAHILRTLDYDNQDRRIRTRKEIPFIMSGCRVDAKTDVCVMDRADYLLLVQEDKRSSSVEPQLIAEFIAAFYQNNRRRELAGRPRLESQLMAGITMVGTAPYFYRVLVTEALLTAVETASFPNEETVVLRFIPPVPDMDSYVSDGMRPLENRRIIFQCLEAFKAALQ